MSRDGRIRNELMDLWKLSDFKPDAETLPSNGKDAIQHVLHAARSFMRDLEHYQPRLLNALGASKREILFTWILKEEGVWTKPEGTTADDWLGPRDVGSQPPASTPPRGTSDS